MATHSSILAWRVPWMEEPAELGNLWDFMMTCLGPNVPLQPLSPGFMVEASWFWNKYMCNQSREKGNWRGFKKQLRKTTNTVI